MSHAAIGRFAVVAPSLSWGNRCERSSVGIDSGSKSEAPEGAHLGTRSKGSGPNQGLQ
jgi:hypothetical protein